MGHRTVSYPEKSVSKQATQNHLTRQQDTFFSAFTKADTTVFHEVQTGHHSTSTYLHNFSATLYFCYNIIAEHGNAFPILSYTYFTAAIFPVLDYSGMRCCDDTIIRCMISPGPHTKKDTWENSVHCQTVLLKEVWDMAVS